MTDYNEQDRHTMARLALALEAMDQALGIPYSAAPMKTRVESWLYACQGLPDEAIDWAKRVACATFEKYPVASQFARLARASPAWQAILDAKKKPHEEKHVSLKRCDECGEPRAWHRILPFSDAPRPLVIRGIRHRTDCSHRLDEGEHGPSWWVDPPRFGRLTEDCETWEPGDNWKPRQVRAGATVEPAPIATPVSVTTQAERDERAAHYKQAAQEAKHGKD